MLVVVLLACLREDDGETDATDTVTSETGDTAGDVVLTDNGAPADLRSFRMLFREAAIDDCRDSAGASQVGNGVYPTGGCYDPNRFAGCAEQVDDHPFMRQPASSCTYDIPAADGCLYDIENFGGRNTCPDDGSGWTAPDGCFSVCGPV